MAVRKFWVAVVMTMLSLACSNGGLSDYLEQAEPIFEEHGDEYALVSDALDVLIACTDYPATTECSATDLLDASDRYVAALDRYERVASVYMEKWVAELRPPDEALRFHELTYELFQLRRTAFYTTRFRMEQVMEYPSLAYEETYVATFSADMQRSIEQLDRSDRLVIRVLAEARKLGL